MKWVLSCAILLGANAEACATGSGDPSVEEDGGTGAIEASANEASANEASDDGYPGAAQEGGAAEASASDSALPGDASGNAPDAESPDAEAGDAGPDPQDATPPFDANPPDGAEGGPVDVARAGTGYTWQSMTSATADTGRLAAPALNDGSPSTQVNIDSSSGDKANAWEAAGVVFASPLTVASVSFVQGTTGSSTSGDGWFEANFGLEVSTDGTSWSAQAWSSAPAYGYSSGVSGKTFTFSGAPLSGVRGVRVVGQVNTAGKSWWAAANEVMVFGP
jgi:hypothetical protein